MNIGITIRLYPTEEQKVLMDKTFGCVRQLYNLHLNERNQYWESVKQLPKEQRPKYKPTTEKQWKEQFPYLKEVSSVALQQTRIDCDDAFSKWFKNNSQFKHPKFKSKHNHQDSYRE